jgi:hypothetical protein
MEEGSSFVILEDEMCLFPFQDLQYNTSYFLGLLPIPSCT